MNKEVTIWTKEIINVIRKIQKEFSNNKGLILTEGDLECHLYKHLTESSLFSSLEETKTNGWKSGYVHSQVTWFKPCQNSGFRVDLTVCKPKNIDIKTLEMVENYPNKGFFHDGMAVAIELKYIRDNSPGKISNDAKKDYVKIVKKLKVAKELLIESKKYTNVTIDDIAFIGLIVCKTQEIYDIALEKLKKAMAKNNCPKNVFPIIFCHEKLQVMNKPPLAQHQRLYFKNK